MIFTVVCFFIRIAVNITQYFSFVKFIRESGVTFSKCQIIRLRKLFVATVNLISSSFTRKTDFINQLRIISRLWFYFTLILHNVPVLRLSFSCIHILRCRQILISYSLWFIVIKVHNMEYIINAMLRTYEMQTPFSCGNVKLRIPGRVSK